MVEGMIMMRSMTIPKCPIEQKRKWKERHNPTEAECHPRAACREFEGAATLFYWMAELHGCRAFCSLVHSPELTHLGPFQHVWQTTLLLFAVSASNITSMAWQYHWPFGCYVQEISDCHATHWEHEAIPRKTIHGSYLNEETRDKKWIISICSIIKTSFTRQLEVILPLHARLLLVSSLPHSFSLLPIQIFQP